MNTDSLIKRYLVPLAVPVSLFILMQALPDGFMRLENRTIDSRYMLRSYMDKGPELRQDITLVAVDDFTHSSYGLDELPLESYAILLEELDLMHPKQLAVDIFIKDKLGCEQEARKEIIDGMLLFVSPYVTRMGLGADRDARVDRKYDSFVWDGIGLDMYPRAEDTVIPAISDIVSYNDAIFYGYTNIISDSDGKMRRMPIVASLNGRVVPHLVLQMIIEGTQYDVSKMALDGQSLILKEFPSETATTDLVIPLDSDGLMPINFMRYDSYKSQSGAIENSYISAFDIIENRGQNPDLGGRLAILGDVSTSGQDIIGTPLEKMHKPIIYHMVANSILSRDFITHSTIAFDFIILIIISVFLLSIASNSSTLQLAVSGFLAILGYLLLSYVLFIYMYHIVGLISVTLPATVMFLGLLGAHIYRSQVRMGVLEGSLSSYLSPNLMERVKEDPDILKLGGSRKKISVLFSDIVGFTSFCDSVDSAEVQEVLEDYFSKMTRAIFNSDGVVDKYLGDGILAFFENERDSISSPLNAMSAALAMQEGARELDKLYQGMNRPPFEIRIGIATGYAKVGNIGPPEKVDYTVIGSVVNKASRLEGKAEPGGIAIDEETFVFVGDDYDFDKKENQELRGFSDKINIYVL